MDLLSNGPLTGEDAAPEAFVGAGSFRCRDCGYVLTLSGEDTLSDCPGCGGSDFKNEARAPIREALSGVIQDDEVTVSPSKLGAGPVEITI